jgi:hypothetical protein
VYTKVKPTKIVFNKCDNDIKNKINKLETELSSYLGNEHDMTDDNIRLRNQVELLKEETKLAKDQLRKLLNSNLTLSIAI